MNAKDVQTWFEAEGIAEHFSFESEGNYVVVRAKNWLGKDVFAKAMNINRQHNGEWVRSGKLSHFRFGVNTQQPVKTEELSFLGRLEALSDELGEIIREIREKGAGL